MTGGAGELLGSPLRALGNNIFFKDQYSLKQLGTDVLMGAAIGGVISGAVAWAKGQNVWWGNTVRPAKVDPSSLWRDDFSGNGGEDSTIFPEESNGSGGVGQIDEITIQSTKIGTFNISNWGSYPGGLPKPKGPFRLIEGAEYKQALDLKIASNKAFRKLYNIGSEFEVHEIQPIKFGGSPTEFSNKIVLPKAFHRGIVTPWWNSLQKSLNKIK